MKKLLLVFISIALFPSYSSAQIIYGANVIDSTVLSFADSNTYPANIIADTSAQPLWQIGITHKSFFSLDTNGIKAIMTDTLNPYPINADNWFTLEINQPVFNQIITFWHRYQTDTGHDGGIVEFSTDSGATWQNVTGDCDADGGFQPGIHTENFYSANDTLQTGQAAFNGSSNGSVCSRLQFFMGFPIKLAGGNSCSFSDQPIYLRFRFVSDSVTDTLAGWMIDSISLREDDYGSAVPQINKVGILNIYPNPSNEGIFNFPVLPDEQDFYIEIYNTIGDKILKMPYTHLISLEKYPDGAYYYKVTNGTIFYVGEMTKD